jgi:acyl-CoA reductase-like NAD-dependent aldehyde dehydrogenase
MTVTDAPLGVLPQPHLLIGAERLTSSSAGEHLHIYPATGRPTRSVPLAGPKEIDRAVRAARDALPTWRGTTVDQRREALLRLAGLLRDNAAELGRLQTVENGTPACFAQLMPHVSADLLAYNAGWADKVGGEVIATWPAPALDYSLDEPYGVVGIIVPWNGPLVSIAMTAAPALAAGNTVVIKPPELTPFTGLRFGELCLEAGIPPGVVNVVPGGPVGGDALVRHPGVDKLHFTGSDMTARKILAAALDNLIPVGLELGGKSANIIFGDADLRASVEQAVQASFMLSGQGCINGTRLLVQDAVYDEVIEIVTNVIAALSVGDPSKDTTAIGPVVNQAAMDRILTVIDGARDGGMGKLIAGGSRVGGDLGGGYFVEPTVFTEVDNASSLAQDEIFGPVLAVLRFDSEAQAVSLANDTRYGLAGYLHTNDLRRAHRVAAALTAGNVWINGYTGIPASVPFGGTKQSGYGRLGGIAGIREFTRPKNVWCAL